MSQKETKANAERRREHSLSEVAASWVKSHSSMSAREDMKEREWERDPAGKEIGKKKL